jgi:hypothetical protein
MALFIGFEKVMPFPIDFDCLSNKLQSSRCYAFVDNALQVLGIFTTFCLTELFVLNPIRGRGIRYAKT